MSVRRDFQERVAKELSAGKSVLQIAPTGLGKTRAAIEPFTTGARIPLLGTRLLYALPLRSLAEGILEELEKLAPAGMSRGVHYGERAESAIFSEQACVTTIDQYLAAFAGAPLSSFTDTNTGWRLGRAKVGHAAAGAVLTSYSVFDEVHLLDPKSGLQLLMAVLQQRRRWGLLSVVSTATLPDSVVQYLTKDPDGPGLRLVEALAKDVAERDGPRRVTLELAHDLGEMQEDGLLQLCRSGLKEHGKVIVFANTVGRAIAYYEALKEEFNGNRVMLVHSRYAPRDRIAKEKQVRTWFGRESTVEEGILVTTQVAEAGLNISAPLVLSELCPADSLVQRAGRCARFGGNGRIFVFKPARDERYWLPYPELVIRDTERVLPSFQGLLDWPREEKLVNEALGERYGAWVRGESPPEQSEPKAKRGREGGPVDSEGEQASAGKRQPTRLRPIDALGPFERAFRSHSPYELEQWLRNPEGRPLSVQVAVAESEEQARTELTSYRLPEMVTVPFGVFYRSLQGKQVWEVDSAELGKGSSEKRSTRTSQVVPGRTYLLLKDEAGYSVEEGLTLDGPGAALGWNDLPLGQRYQDQGRYQTFEEHTRCTLDRASRMLSRYAPFLQAWAQAVLGAGVPLDDVVLGLTDAMRIAAAFHDVGKLRELWQEAAGWHPGQEPVARFPRGAQGTEGRGKLPHHAAFANPFLQELFRQAQGKDSYLRPLEFIALATARHHSLGVTGEMALGRFIDGALPLLLRIARSVDPQLQGEWVEAAFNRIARPLQPGDPPLLSDEAPSPSDDFYPIYCIAQRLIKVADWEDAGDREIELREGGDVK